MPIYLGGGSTVGTTYSGNIQSATIKATGGSTFAGAMVAGSTGTFAGALTGGSTASFLGVISSGAGLYSAGYAQGLTLRGGPNASFYSEIISDAAASSQPTLIQITDANGNLLDFAYKNLLATGTNDSAAAGAVGQILTASLAAGSATSLSTGTAKTIISISLTAGDWDVTGVVDYIPAATTTTAFVKQGASATDNTLGAADTFSACSGGNLTGTVLGSLIAEIIPVQRFSLADTTTVYLVGLANFAISTLTAYGTIRARRVR